MDKPHLPVYQGTVLKLDLSEGPKLYGVPVVYDINHPPITIFIGYLFSLCLTFHSLIPTSWESPPK